MKILSIDIGIKNLAICLFEKTETSEEFVISQWEVINLADKNAFGCCKMNKNNKCDSPAKYHKNNEFFCTRHAKKEPYQLPKKELKAANIKKLSLVKLIQFAIDYNVDYNKPPNKTDLINNLTNYYNTHFFQEIIVENGSTINLIEVAANIKSKLNDTLANYTEIDHVIIENQIGPNAIRMKMVQGMILQYFVMCAIFVDNIEFISAKNKLKDINIDKNKDDNNYKNRKKMSVDRCLEIISTSPNYSNKIDFFKHHKKKDDLSDTFLQGMWFIKENNL